MMAKSLHTPAYGAFSQLMKKAREKAGLTQEQLANKLGKPQSFVSKLEKCERRIDVLEFIDVCAALGLDPAAQIRKLQRQAQGRDEVS